MKRGFILFETLLVLALLGTIGIFFISFLPFRQTSDLQSAFEIMISIFEKTQEKAQFTDGDSAWGVKLNPPRSVTIFKGGSYENRDLTSDELFVLSDNISVSGLEEVVFQKLTGYPLITGAINLSNNAGQTKNFFINEKGVLIY